MVKQAKDKKTTLIHQVKQEMIFYTGLVITGDNDSQAQLNQWKRYWQQLNTIDCSLAPNIQWPIAPSEKE